MSNKDRNKDSGSKQENRQNAKNQQDNNRDNNYRSTNLRDSQMMAHLLDAMEQGQDVGHYGRLVFVMVGRFFLSDEELLDMLSKQPDYDETEARAHILQVRERGYNPPRRERILQWMEQQEFPICPDPDDPNGCNVYRDLQFPEDIYENIEDFWEEKAEAKSQDEDGGE